MSKNIGIQQFHQEQREYVKQQEIEGQQDYVSGIQDGAGIGLVDDEMMAHNMRTTRYNDEAHAMCDLVDNSIESGAKNVSIAFNSNEKGAITEIAILDDGAGFDQSFITHSVRWGATGRGKRKAGAIPATFGRFGQGLSSASVKAGTKFFVYSRVNTDDPFYSVSLDLHDLPKNEAGRVCAPSLMENSPLPAWLIDYAEKNFEGGVGNVSSAVIWTDFDRLKWKNIKSSVPEFLMHFGITYGKWILPTNPESTCLKVDKQRVDPIDPLFIEKDHRYTEIDGFDSARTVLNKEIPVKDVHNNEYDITVRISQLTKNAFAAKTDKKVRFNVRKSYNGVFITRNGRFIECIRPAGSDFGVWSNYKRQIGIAIDFPPELDILFGVTADKQTVVLSDRVLDRLLTENIFSIIKQLERDVHVERHDEKVARELGVLVDPDGLRPSESVLEQIENSSIRRKIVKKPTKEQLSEAEKSLERYVKEEEAKAGVPVDKEQLIENLSRRPFKLTFDDRGDDSPFFTFRQIGGQFNVEINTDHLFYRNFYNKESVNLETRMALETIIFILAKTENQQEGEAKFILRNARKHWSNELTDVLDLLPSHLTNVALPDEKSVEAETAEANIDDEIDSTEVNEESNASA